MISLWLFVGVVVPLILALGFVLNQREEARDERDTARRQLADTIQSPSLAKAPVGSDE